MENLNKTENKEGEQRKAFERRKEATKKEAEEQLNQNSAAASNEYIEQMQRLQAEFENYKKRTEKDKQELSIYAKASFIKEVLSIVDSFELAMSSMKKHTILPEVFQGIEMVYKQLTKLLESEGVKPIEAVGQKLDPFKHEVLIQKEAETDGIVLEELQKGYMFQDKVIRTSKVAVSKLKEAK